MTDSLKLAEMQRTSIDFERQRHLANWFIKSSPHMATPSPSLNLNGISGTKNGTITGNPLFFVVSTGQNKHQPIPPSGIGVNSNPNGLNGTVSGNIALSRSQLLTSQTNLPLQIVTSSSQEGRKPKLRRFNSHDTSANMFSVADFENARLARRNEIEMKQRQQQRLKMNSLSSGGDCSTGDSKGSKYSNESQTEPLAAEIFLDRYSLPRVVRISYKQKFSHETLQSSSSNGSSSTQSSTSLSNKTHSELNKQNGELFLLYRHLRQRHIYHGFNTKTGIANRKKGVMIPQEFPGYFSLINDKGSPSATQYTTLTQLVRERVHKFISVDNLPAFTESQSTTNTPDGFVSSRPHYIKITARGGQVFRLSAVFEDGNQQDTTTKFSSSNSGREKEKGRYAQLFNENRQVLYVSLSAKGKFYEIEPSIPQILQKVGINNNSSSNSANNGDHKRKLNPDCVHRISNLISPDKIFPINLKFISGPQGMTVSIPDNITITHISIENVIIGCPIEDASIDSGHNQHLKLRKLPVTNEMTFMKCLLGFENEQRMLANPNVQNILKYCQFNCDPFIKTIEIEVLSRPERSGSKSRVDGLKKLNFPKLLRREKTTIAHEKEDSIIFLSKNDLANLEAKQDQTSSDQQNRMFSEKMKVFQSTKKKWFKRNEKHTSMTSLDLDIQAKRMSMERYNDMSKLLQERFGDEVLAASHDRPSSEIGGTIRINTNNGIRLINSAQQKAPIQKSLSLQDVDFIEKQPDLLPANFTETNLADSMRSLSMKNHEQIGDNPESGPSNENKICTNSNKQFISEKMYSEFHVKTRQYSKSSSSLHQLLHFAVPQKMNVVETKKPKQGTSNEFQQSDHLINNSNKKLEFLIGDPVSNTSHDDYNSSTIIDDLPYSSVRDSLLVSDSCNGEQNAIGNSSVLITNGSINGNDFNFSNFGSYSINGGVNKTNNNLIDVFDDTRENIYAEICHHNMDSSNCSDSGITTAGAAISRIQINGNSNNELKYPEILIKGANIVASSSSQQQHQHQQLNGQHHQLSREAISDNCNDDGASIDNIYNTLK